jgi:hypothetical protein
MIFHIFRLLPFQQVLTQIDSNKLDIVSVSCTQFKRPNITCFIFNSTSYDQITGSGRYSDTSTDIIYIGSYNCSNLGYIRKYIFFTGSTAFLNSKLAISDL